MSDLRELYQQVILDHNKNPRNFGELATATETIEGYNPLCGDHYTIFVERDGDTVKQVNFIGSGCAISKASASVMSTVVKGKSLTEATRLFDIFHKMVTGEGAADTSPELERLAAFSGVSEFPARVKCASLPWHTLKTALDGKSEPVSTE